MKRHSPVKRGGALLLFAVMLLSIFGIIPAASAQAEPVTQGTARAATTDLPAIPSVPSTGIQAQIEENTIPALVVTEDSIWYGSDGPIPSDLYVAPDTVLTIAGSTVLEGDLYNYGVVIVQGVLDVEYVYSNRYLTEYPKVRANGDLIQDPHYSSMVVARELLSMTDITDLPLMITSSPAVNRKGYLPLVEGAALPFVDLALEGQSVELQADGSFREYDFQAGSAGALQFSMIDPFGNTFSCQFDLTRGVYPEAEMEVLAGSNRYRTAQAISSQMYQSAETAVLVNAQNFPDALAAGPLAFALGAPILLTNSDTLPAVTSQELARLGVSHVIIMGGTVVISEAVEAELLASYTTGRVAGANRYGTALAAADQLIALGGDPTTLVMTSGVNFPDALSAGSLASVNGYPILLSNGLTLHERDRQFIDGYGVEQVILMGGPNAISTAIQDSLLEMGLTVDRIAGSNREATSAEMAYRYFANASHAVVASGYNFVDALAAIPYAASLEAPVLLVREDRLSGSVDQYLKSAFVHQLSIIGGDAVVGPLVRDRLLLAIE